MIDQTVMKQAVLDQQAILKQAKEQAHELLKNLEGDPITVGQFVKDYVEMYALGIEGITEDPAKAGLIDQMKRAKETLWNDRLETAIPAMATLYGESGHSPEADEANRRLAFAGLLLGMVGGSSILYRMVHGGAYVKPEQGSGRMHLISRALKAPIKPEGTVRDLFWESRALVDKLVAEDPQAFNQATAYLQEGDLLHTIREICCTVKGDPPSQADAALVVAGLFGAMDGVAFRIAIRNVIDPEYMKGSAADPEYKKMSAAPWLPLAAALRGGDMTPPNNGRLA